MALFLILAAAAFAQEFEVVSVKPDKSLSNGSHTNSDQGRFTARNVTLKSLIQRAYGVNDYQVSGPDWLDTERYDVDAKFPEALPRDPAKYGAAFEAMMQHMLAGRFKLKVRRENRPYPVLDLVVAKGGIKFKEVPDRGDHNSDSSNRHYTGTCVDMSGFAKFLSRRLEEPVLDKTGLTGYYDLKLDWSSDARDDPEPQAITIPVAVRDQLGLRLEERKEPLEFIVVDHAEKVPIEN